VCDYSRPPFAKWFVGGKTNLCYNAVDRHAAKRPNDRALIYISTETDEKRLFLCRTAARSRAHGRHLQEPRRQEGRPCPDLHADDRQATFAILAATRIGAIHSVVFGGFASGSLATRIDDAKPTLIVSSDAGMRGGKAVPYKHLLDEAIALAEHKPAKVLMVDRGLDKEFSKVAGRDVDYATLRDQFMDARSSANGWNPPSRLHPLHLRHDRQAEGRPARHRRLCRGTGSSMKHIYCGGEGETFFSTSDIGWVVGHPTSSTVR
jgi:propionyl-CoA synthetase